MMDMVMLLIINMLWIIALGCGVFFVTKEVIKVQREKNNLHELVEAMNFDYQRIHNLIDEIIDEAGTLYKIQYSNYDHNENVVLSKDDIRDMMEFMVREVVQSITPSIEITLKTITNFDTQEELLEYITKKVKLYVINYNFEIKKETYK